jgi:hypothetical protein
MDMVLPPHRVLLSALVHVSRDDEARERIRRLFHSPLGVYVSHASRNHAEVRVEFDVASEDLAFTIRTLRQVLPDAEVEEVRPLITTVNA